MLPVRAGPGACACGGCPVHGAHAVEVKGLSVFAQRPLVLLTSRARWKRLSSRRRGARRVRAHCSIHRNRDFQEVTLERDGAVLLRFAAAYGFRNVQNVVLKLKRGKFPYHFVEVLACAGGEAPPRPAPRSAQQLRGAWTSLSPLTHLVRKGWALRCLLESLLGEGVSEKSHGTGGTR